MDSIVTTTSGSNPEMGRLLPVTIRPIGDQEINAIDGRTLHQFLEVGKDFTTWMKDHIESFGFQEHQDFEIFDSPNLGNQGRGGDRRSKAYALSLSMAKELAMVQRNEKGKQARCYFIECERRAKHPAALNLSRMDLITLAMEAEQERLTLAEKVQVLEPKAEALDRIGTAGEGSYCLTNAAKVLGVPPKQFFLYLQSKDWIYRRVGGQWTAYQERLKAGLLEHKLVPIHHRDDCDEFVDQVKVTAKGMARLSELLNAEAAHA